MWSEEVRHDSASPKPPTPKPLSLKAPTLAVDGPSVAPKVRGSEGPGRFGTGFCPLPSLGGGGGVESSKTYPYPRGLAGPKIADFRGRSGPFLPQSPLEKVGGFAPHIFQWALQ